MVSKSEPVTIDDIKNPAFHKALDKINHLRQWSLTNPETCWACGQPKELGQLRYVEMGGPMDAGRYASGSYEKTLTVFTQPFSLAICSDCEAIRQGLEGVEGKENKAGWFRGGAWVLGLIALGTALAINAKMRSAWSETAVWVVTLVLVVLGLGFIMAGHLVARQFSKGPRSDKDALLERAIGQGTDPERLEDYKIRLPWVNLDEVAKEKEREALEQWHEKMGTAQDLRHQVQDQDTGKIAQAYVRLRQQEPALSEDALIKQVAKDTGFSVKYVAANLKKEL